MTCLQLKVSPGFIDGLDQLAGEIGDDRSEIVRRAVALLWHAREQQGRGRKLGFFSEEDGRIVVKTTVTL